MTYEETLAMAQAIYRTRKGSGGCCLHIVLDDGNLEAGNVESCLQWAKEARHKRCRDVAEALLEMNMSEREHFYRDLNRISMSDWEF